MRYRFAGSSEGMATMSGGGGGETRIRRQGEPVGSGDTLDDISTMINRDRSNQVVGKLVVVEGPGTGNEVKIYTGTNQIGRGDDMRVQLNFGDDTISRQQHAVITFDSKKLEARIHDGGKPGGLWVNGTRITGDQQIKSGDLIKLGETTLKLDQA
jgi:pSer/pThr/pTyr-binding forkhead associated (FHA) protein